MNTDASKDTHIDGIAYESAGSASPAQPSSLYDPEVAESVKSWVCSAWRANAAPNHNVDRYEGTDKAARDAGMKQRAISVFGPESASLTPTDPIRVLLRLDLIVLEQMAIDPKTPAAVLAELATHANADLKALVAEHGNVSAATMANLINDRNPDVRYQLAENPRLNFDILKTLSEDENPYVASRAQQTLCRLQTHKN